MSEPLLLLDDVAFQLRVHRSTVSRLAKCKLLGCYRFGSSVRFTQSQVDEYLARCVQPPQSETDLALDQVMEECYR